MGQFSNPNGGNPASPSYGAGGGSFRPAHPHGAAPIYLGTAEYSVKWVHHSRSQVADIQALLYGIRTVLNDAKMPEHLPFRYHDSLLALLEACCDRRDGRASRFDHAVSTLAGPLAIAQSDSELFSLKRALKIDDSLAKWRVACSGGPAPLPRAEDQRPEKFQYKYVATGGETIMQVAEHIGLENPGAMAHPMYGYQLHMHLRKGDTVFVPFPKPLLEALIEKTKKLKEAADEQLKEVLETLELQEKDMEATLLLIEAASVCANVLAGLVFGAKVAAEAAEVGAKAAKGAGLKLMAKDGEVLANAKYAKALHHLNEEMKVWGLETASHTALEFLGWGFELSESIQGFFTRHPNLGNLWRYGPVSWLSPKFWAPVVAAGWQELRIFGFTLEKVVGLDTTGRINSAKRDRGEVLAIFWLAEQTRSSFKLAAELKIDELNRQIEFAGNQMKSPVYTYKP